MPEPGRLGVKRLGAAALGGACLGEQGELVHGLGMVLPAGSLQKPVGLSAQGMSAFALPGLFRHGELAVRQGQHGLGVAETGGLRHEIPGFAVVLAVRLVERHLGELAQARTVVAAGLLEEVCCLLSLVAGQGADAKLEAGFGQAERELICEEEIKHGTMET